MSNRHFFFICFNFLILAISCDSNNSTPAPTISDMQPESGPPGTMVTIKGSGFSTDASAITVTFDSLEAEVVSATETEIQVIVPEGAESGAIIISIGETYTSGPNFTVQKKSPGISSVEPDSGTIGTEVTINGMNFDNSLSGNIVSFNEINARVIGATTDQLITEVPEGASDGPVKVRVGERTAVGPDFNVITSGTLEILITTTGEEPDPDGYVLSINENEYGATEINDTVIIEDLEEGNYSVEISDISLNCAIENKNPVDVTITPGDTFKIEFNIYCQAIVLDDQIVFSREVDGDGGNMHRLYKMSSDGSNAQQIGDEFYTYTIRPSSSPNGERLAYAARENAAGEYNLYTINADGSNPVKVVNERIEGRHSWSPGGDTIIFSIGKEIGNRLGSEIYTISNDGTGLTQITDNDFDFYTSSPSWSPGGNKIAFATTRGTSSAERNIYTMNPDGSTWLQLTDNHGIDRNPVWSPDGSKIAFDSQTIDDDREIFVMNADGSDLIQITDNNVKDSNPSWSPDGTEIVFVRDREIIKMNADGSGTETNLTDNNIWDDYPYWNQ